jgi:hypothetical protein
MLTFTISGTDGNGNEWNYGGELPQFDNPLDLSVAMQIGKDAFAFLTHNEAHYGEPGKGGCRGPYRVHSLTINTRSIQ